MLISLLLTSCISKNSEVNNVNIIEKEKENKNLERAFEVKNNKKIGPVFSEKLDLNKKGIYVPLYQNLSSRMTIGDDGECYFFRKSSDDSHIVFKKNNEINVMITEMPKELEKKGYIIDAFVKYKDKFFVSLFSSKSGKSMLTCIEISDGKWNRAIKHDGFDRLIVYDNMFYGCIGRELTTMDLHGNIHTVELGKAEDEILIQGIISDRVFYSKFAEDHSAVLMCCNLDGKAEEELFTYHTIIGNAGYSDPSSIKFDDNYLYLLEPMLGSALVRIPLYGGEIQEIVATNWFELSDTYIFFVDNQNNVCKIDKSLGSSSQKVTKACENEDSIPFYYADNHLMIEGFNKKEYYMLSVIWESEVSDKIIDDITMYYAPNYYWITMDGEIDTIIKGSGFRKEYYALYKAVK